MEKSCIFQEPVSESESESDSGNGNKPQVLQHWIKHTKDAVSVSVAVGGRARHVDFVPDVVSVHLAPVQTAAH